MEKILPALITLAGNFVFYLIIKAKVDKSIEKNKISYTGIFKEKILIYRELLERTYDIKRTLSRFQYFGTEADGNEIMKAINEYIRFYQVNQPFLSDQMLYDLNIIRKEFQEIFDEFFKEIATRNFPSRNRDRLKDFFEAGNKLRQNQPFEKIEKNIITEMKKDLKMKNFKG